MMIGKITRKLHRIRSFKLRKEEKGTKRLLLNIIFSVGLATFLALSANAICSFAGEEQPDYQENGVNYFIHGDTAYVGLSGGAQGDISILPTITVNNVDYNVTSIQNSAFASNDELTFVDLSASNVETIGEGAFAGCSNLSQIDFAGPSNLTTIGRSAFNECINLQYINIPSSVTTIGEGAFWGCSNLSQIDFAGPSNLTTIGTVAFKNCTNLQYIKIPSSVTTIGADAFTGTNLEYITVTLGFDFTKFENSGIIVEETYWGGKIFSVKDTSINGGTFEVEYPSGTCGDNLEWRIYQDYDYKKEQNIYSLAITGTGDMNDFADGSSVPWASYSSIIAKIILPDDITKIGANAFSGCVGLTEISIPANVASVGNNAFSGCTDLTNIFIKDKDNDTLNLSGKGLENDAIIWKYKAEGSMGEKTLVSLSGKKADGSDIPSDNSIIIYCNELGENYEINSVPQGVSLKHKCSPFEVEINKITWSCRRLEGNNVSIRPCQNTITGDVIIPSTVQFSNLDFTVTAIMDNAFERCSNLQSIKIPKNVTSIGIAAFSGSINLKEIKVDSENTAYVSDDGVLYDKNKTTLICYPEGKEGDSFTIPASVTKIEIAAISSCQYLKTVNFAEGTQIEEIGNGAFVVNFDKQLSSSVKTVNIPARVTKIGSGAFGGCTNLENVNFEENSQLKEIGNAAFVMCTSLKNINLPESVATIGKDEKDPVMGAEGMVFGACSGLESITIPKNVTTIGKFSFLECSSLADVYVKDGLDVSGAGIQDSANIWRYAVLPEEQQTIQGKTLVQIPSVTKGDGSAISGSISLSSTDMGDKYLIEEVECCATGDKTNGWTVYGAHNYEIEYNWTEEENGSWKCTEKKTCKNGCGETETESMIITPYNGMYDGNEHSAVANISGEISGATISYSTDNSTWNSEVPKCTEVGTYTIYVKVQNNEDETIFETQQMVVTIKEYEPGDINKSGEVDVIDLQMLYNHVTENSVITDEEQLKLANINNDSYIDVLDLQALFNIIASS